MNVSYSEIRRNKILELIVEAYVSTAAPVGSAWVSRKLRSSLSPATIRHIMAELEREGLVVQPHTSAGRVPTDRGWRFYVDVVMEAPRPTAEQVRRFEAMLQPVALDIERLLSRAGHLLSDVSQQATFVVSPTVKQSTVKQIELVPVSLRKVLCVLVANEEIVASHLVEMEEPVTRDEALSLARFLNTELAGLSFTELIESLERRLLAEHDSFYHVVKRSFAILQQALSTEPDDRLLLDGTSRLMSQPEFSRNPRKAHELLRGLDAEEALVERLRHDLKASGVAVRIGREVAVPGLDDCSYVAAPFAIGPDVIGGIGVLGPKRMDYPRMRALVEGMGRCLTALISELEAIE